MNPIINTDSGVSTVPVSVVQPTPNTSIAGQPVYPQPMMVPGNGVQQANPAMYQMAYQPGAQSMMPPVAYTPQAYGPVNQMPSE